MTDAVLYIGDCMKALSQLSDKSVNTCVTSPPYYGLRDYGHDDQIGHESSPDEYVAKMVQMFREVRRVLRDDGTLWLNLGDSYCGYKGDNYGKTKGNLTARTPTAEKSRLDIGTPQTSGIKNKDLIGIPWRVAFALQSDGWYLRQDIIWHKPNPIPESVKDRCTKAHEYIFLLSKSARYYFNQDAIKEPLAASSIARLSQNVDDQLGSDRVPGKTNGRMKAVGCRFGGKKYGDSEAEETRTKSGKEYTNGDGKRNPRSVWTVTTKPYKGAHFATFPPDLIEPCIKAGCPIDGIVLDPFIGSGTTGLIALQQACRFIGIELNSKYLSLIEKRLKPVISIPEIEINYV